MKSLLAFHKEMKKNESPAEIVEAVVAAARISHPVGVIVKVVGTSHTGKVVSYNEKVGGFYPGDRYPIHVEITKSGMPEAIGNTFEYEAKQLTIV